MNTPNSSDLLKGGAGILLGSAAVAGLYFAGRAVVRSDREKNAGSRVFDGREAPAQFAQRLSLAFQNCGWWGCLGTDEEEIYRVANEVPSRSAWGNVEREYRRLYGRTLSIDIEAELDTADYMKLIGILNDKPN